MQLVAWIIHILLDSFVEVSRPFCPRQAFIKHPLRNGCRTAIARRLVAEEVEQSGAQRGNPEVSQFTPRAPTLSVNTAINRLHLPFAHIPRITVDQALQPRHRATGARPVRRIAVAPLAG